MRMLVTLEFADAGTKSGSHRVLIIGRGSEDPQTGDIGLSLEEAKTLISSIQDEFVAAQAAEIVEARRRCGCGKKLSIKDWKLRRIHTAYGRVYLPSPRMMSCTCDGSPRRAISPLKGWLTRSSNELRYLAAKLASQHSYRQAAAILHELLGVHLKFGHVSVRAATLDAGGRLDQDHIREPFADWRRVRSAPRSVTLAFDGGYARRIRKGSRRNFEILTGAGEIDGKIWVFATVHKAVSGLKRRLNAFVSRLHINSEQPIALMTDGAESLLRLKTFMPVPTQFVLDYFHVSMKLRHIDQCIGAIPPMVLSPDGSVFELYDRFNYLRGYLWSGKRAKFEESVDRLLELLDRAQEMVPDLHRSIQMAAGHLCDLAWYIRKNESGVINYGQWKREGRRISTSAVEGTVNRLIGRRLGKGQHMCWTKRGAHLLLQVRCAVLNGELLKRFQRWFPGVGTRQVGLPWHWVPHHS
jgi:hypothetical protein